MKTYGEILRLARNAYIKGQSHIAGDYSDGEWEKIIDAASEVAAHAVIEEFKRRHNIVISPEED